MSLWVEDLRTATGEEYRVDCFEVNSVNYGAPQIRERAIFIGNREGLKLDFPQPTHGPVQGSKLPLSEDVVLRPWATLRGCDREPRQRMSLSCSTSALGRSGTFR